MPDNCARLIDATEHRDLRTHVDVRRRTTRRAERRIGNSPQGDSRWRVAAHVVPHHRIAVFHFTVRASLPVPGPGRRGRRVDLRGAGEPQSECDLARRDEVTGMGETRWERAGARRQASHVARRDLEPRPGMAPRTRRRPAHSGLALSGTQTETASGALSPWAADRPAAAF